MTHQILALDIQGTPVKWMSVESAIYRLANNKVAWTLGDEESLVFHGGLQKSGARSRLIVPPIIALSRSEGMAKHFRDIPLGQRDNKLLFKRDRYICILCGQRAVNPTREHIIPQSRGGKDVWSNVACACAGCNHRKGARLPEEARMSLHYVPYVPSRWEHFILAGRNILSDQMDYLAAKLPRHSRLRH